jgi:hypothetical protein
MSNGIVWLHGDSLSPTDPALDAHPAAPAVFIFDEPFLQTARLSFKRLMFLYECALEAIAGRSGEIRRGGVVEELLDFAAQHGAEAIYVTHSVAPRFQAYLRRLREHVRVEVYQPVLLVEWEGTPPRRFSAFWRKIADNALQPNGAGPDVS